MDITTAVDKLPCDLMKPVLEYSEADVRTMEAME
jgi:hypothetical protein